MFDAQIAKECRGVMVWIINNINIVTGSIIISNLLDASHHLDLEILPSRVHTQCALWNSGHKVIKVMVCNKRNKKARAAVSVWGSFSGSVFHTRQQTLPDQYLEFRPSHKIQSTANIDQTPLDSLVLNSSVQRWHISLFAIMDSREDFTLNVKTRKYKHAYHTQK